MPNWCENLLVITLPKDHPLVVDFRKIASPHSKPFGLLNLLVPMPVHQPDTKKPNPFFATGGLGSEQKDLYGINNWYDWSVQHWGTKWDVYSDSIESKVFENETSITFEFFFNSAWNPPLRALLSSGLDFDLYYYESGMAYAGHASKDQDNYIDLSNPTLTNTFKTKDEFKKHLEKTILSIGFPKRFLDVFNVEYMFYMDFYDDNESDPLMI
jgi:hypothetical protein